VRPAPLARARIARAPRAPTRTRPRRRPQRLRRSCATPRRRVKTLLAGREASFEADDVLTRAALTIARHGTEEETAESTGCEHT
jgi:hypothetical protein